MAKKGDSKRTVKDVASDAIYIGKGAVESTKEAIVKAIDENDNGEIDIEDIIIKGLRVPGIRINRGDFLRKEFYKHYSEDVINDAVAFNPAHAGITVEEINKIADDVIQYERICVSGISTALGVPGGAAMVATIPADIAQYYGYMLRATQELLYLYGFPEIDVAEKGARFDAETLSIFTICMGVMYGVQGANRALKIMAQALAKGVEKKLLKAALTKGTIYPIVKKVALWFGRKMTKEVFAGFFKKAIPVVGGAIGGVITYVSFKPCCEKLKASLQDTILSNPNSEPVENLDEEIIDAEVVEE